MTKLANNLADKQRAQSSPDSVYEIQDLFGRPPQDSVLDLETIATGDGSNGFDNTEGRECSSCKKQKAWREYYKKPSGINYRDSICKVCINDNRKSKRRTRRQIKSLETERKVSSKISGTLSQDVVLEFSGIFAQGISTLLEKDLLK